MTEERKEGEEERMETAGAPRARRPEGSKVDVGATAVEGARPRERARGPREAIFGIDERGRELQRQPRGARHHVRPSTRTRSPR